MLRRELDLKRLCEYCLMEAIFSADDIDWLRSEWVEEILGRDEYEYL